jgi:hypothetical protein
MSITNDNCGTIYSQSAINILNNSISYTCPKIFQNISSLKGRTLIDKDNNIMMVINTDGNVTIYPITSNHVFVDKEHNEIISFDSNGQISILPASKIQIMPNICSKVIDNKVNTIHDKINRFNELKLKGAKYKNNATTEEEIEFRRLYQAIKYHERDMNNQNYLVSLKQS